MTVGCLSTKKTGPAASRQYWVLGNWELGYWDIGESGIWNTSCFFCLVIARSEATKQSMKKSQTKIATPREAQLAMTHLL